MTSQELRNDKGIFINNVDRFIDEYQDALSKVKALNSSLSNCEDTILKNEMLANNEIIVTNLTNVINKVLSEKAEALTRIDEEINRLQQQENELLRKKENE